MKLSRKHRNTLCHAVMNVVMALAPAGLILFPLSQKALGTPPSETVVRVQAPESADDPRPAYFRDLLKMALDKTAATHGPGSITLTKNIAVQSRNIEYRPAL